MKTKQIMKIEYTEPLMKVKEMSRRRCVVAGSAEDYGYTGKFGSTYFDEGDNVED